MAQGNRGGRKVLDFDFAVTVKNWSDNLQRGVGVRVFKDSTNGNDLYRAGNMLRDNFDKGYDNLVNYEAVKNGARAMLAIGDMLGLGGKLEANPDAAHVMENAAREIYGYCVRRDDKFNAMDAGGFAALKMKPPTPEMESAIATARKRAEAVFK